MHEPFEMSFQLLITPRTDGVPLQAKAALDELIDRAGALVNLRTAISRYRKPRRRFRFFR